MCLATSRIIAVFTLGLAILASGRCAMAAEDVNNAAPIYLKVLDQLPEKGSTEADFLNDAQGIAIQGPIVRFLMSRDEVAQQLHAAAQRGRCDWPAGAEQALLPKVVRFADLEWMRIRWAIEEERLDDALRESSDMIVFAHFVGRMPTSVARMIAAGIAEEMTIKIAAILPAVSDKALAELQKRQANLPRWFTAGEGVDGDRKRIVAELKRLDASKQADLFAKQSVLYDLTGGEAPDAGVRTQVKQLWDDPAKRLDAITAVSLRFAEAVKIAAMPRMQIAKATEEWEQKRLHADILTKSVVPSGKTLRRLQHACLISEVRAAMLQIAIAGRISGTETVMKTLDPSTGKPFKLREWEDGFELQSEVVDTATGKPLKLSIGKPEKTPF